MVLLYSTFVTADYRHSMIKLREHVEKRSPSPHGPVITRFSKDIVQQQNKGSLLNPSVLTTV